VAVAAVVVAAVAVPAARAVVAEAAADAGNRYFSLVTLK
jgi:hypothetical protein